MDIHHSSHLITFVNIHVLLYFCNYVPMGLIGRQPSGYLSSRDHPLCHVCWCVANKFTYLRACKPITAGTAEVSNTTTPGESKVTIDAGTFHGIFS